jgi:hypothetical protein
MANEVTKGMMPGSQLAIVGKQFLRDSFKQAFDRVGGVDAIEDWVMPEVPVYQLDEQGVVMLDENNEKIIIRTERRRNDENFKELLKLMARLEPKEINVRDDRSIESTIDAIEAEFVEVDDE